MSSSIDEVFHGFTEHSFTHNNETKIFYRGGQGPAVIVMHEVPGIYPGVVEFARKVIAQGFTVFMPSLMGTPGKEIGVGYSLDTMARLCVMKEFTVFATNKTSPVIEWLRALARYAHEECGGPGVGAVGMCFSGGFALGMSVDKHMLAPVLSQPSLPFALTKKLKSDIGLDEESLAQVKARVRDENLCVLGLRFSKDFMVPDERFKRLKDELGDNFIAVDIDSSLGNPHGISPVAHSVLVYDNVDQEGHPTRQALDQVLAFFREKLLTES
ncbi:MAG: dienelactone hydrolase family protein [SAR324 cluster bacterium]|nr:dienelactone hydrolase family protein [SAR324 cluster bacterium]